jgi:hypothetical protein
MKKLPINMGDLELALENNAGGIGLELHTYWFDTETGEVIFLTEDLEEQDELREQIQENLANRYVPSNPSILTRAPQHYRKPAVNSRPFLNLANRAITASDPDRDQDTWYTQETGLGQFICCAR